MTMIEWCSTQIRINSQNSAAGPKHSLILAFSRNTYHLCCAAVKLDIQLSIKMLHLCFDGILIWWFHFLLSLLRMIFRISKARILAENGASDTKIVPKRNFQRLFVISTVFFWNIYSWELSGGLFMSLLIFSSYCFCIKTIATAVHWYIGLELCVTCTCNKPISSHHCPPIQLTRK